MTQQTPTMLYRLQFLLLFSLSCVNSLTTTRLPSTRRFTNLRMSEITTTTPFEKSKSTFRRNFTDDMNDFSKDDEDDYYNLSSSSSSWVFPAPNLQYSGIGALPNDNNSSSEYQRGLVAIGFITLLFSSNSPVLHAAFSPTDATTTGPPPVLLLNAAVSVVALVGLLLGGDSLESNALRPSALQERRSTEPEGALALQGGCELGLWKFLGTTANLYGLALTTAGHGALLIQLTTLIVPVVQGIQGVPIPKRIQASVMLALAGVFCFTQDPTGTPSAQGDALCVLAAIFYATYDLRLFAWGKKVAAKRLITTKIGTQAILSVSMLLAVSRGESMEYLASADATTWSSILPAVVWSGVAVNAVAPFLQVGGQQAVGPTRCQTIYASQPLWAAILSFLFLGETIGSQGLIGGSVFLVALFLAATAEAPQADCGEINCEV